jgi:hypothetical protein
VPSKKTLTSTNLEALGVQRLAELLIEVSTGNAAVKRRLRLELAGAHNPDEVAKEVRKRLTIIARSRTVIDWHNRKKLMTTSKRSATLSSIKPTPILPKHWN